MAENCTQTQTTSSNLLDGKNEIMENLENELPKNDNNNKKQNMLNLAENLSQTYQLVKLRQKQYTELANAMKTVPVKIGAKMRNIDEGGAISCNVSNSNTDLCEDKLEMASSTQNKLKRKKTLSTSLTSVTDSVNQEKRTRIEGITLNCRGRLKLEEVHNKNTVAQIPKLNTNINTKSIVAAVASGAEKQLAVTPLIYKRQIQENILTIQKLSALTEQLRVEINELKSNLHSERGAVRVLRAQNESETRKWKNEVRKLQNIVVQLEKGSKPSQSANNDVTPTASSVLTKQKQQQQQQPHIDNSNTVSAADIEIAKLKNEIQMLKKTNKCCDEKKLIYNEADRRKQADIRLLKDSYEIRLTQLQESARTEITRLLEEIKSKGRCMKQLKNDLKVYKGKLQRNETINSRNATNKHLLTNNVKSTTSPVKSTKNLPNQVAKEIATQTEAELKDTKPELETAATQTEEEVTELKISPFCSENRFDNSTKNYRTWKTITINTNTKTANTQTDDNEHHDRNENENDNENTNTNQCNLTATNNITYSNDNVTCINIDNNLNDYLTESNNSEKECESVNEERRIFPPMEIDNGRLSELDCGDYKVKYHHDSDSALSSAPPSISPQPSPEGRDNTDIWQRIPSFHVEIDKWQKEVEALTAINQKLQNDLNLSNQKLNEQQQQNETLLSTGLHMEERVRQLEALMKQLQFERDELQEQNELLEFRVIELEDTNDKWLTQSNPGPVNDVWNCSDYSLTQTMDDSMTSQCYSSLIANKTHHIIDELSPRIFNMLHYRAKDTEDIQCLEQILEVFQKLRNLDGKELEINTEKVKNPCAADKNDTLSLTDNCNKPNQSKRTTPSTRVIATVQPYKSSEEKEQIQNSIVNLQHQNQTESPRKTRTNNALSESGIFVECDFITDSNEPNSCSNSDFEQRNLINFKNCHGISQISPQSRDLKRLQYYQDRLAALESKVLVYESSGDTQTKLLSERLQREILLDKEVKELTERVELLENENAQLEEEKCEFEEAENDTRLRLQRLEVELEIVNQRNVELELSREAFVAKYKDCRGECLNLRDDLVAHETQVKNLEKELQKIQNNYQLLQDILPLLLIYYNQAAFKYIIENSTMGNTPQGFKGTFENTLQPERTFNNYEYSRRDTGGRDHACMQSELQELRDEVKCLRQQIRHLNSRHYEALESADSHWSEMEQEYKMREEAQRNKEALLKSKIAQLQDVLLDDARVANEKIQSLEEHEKELQQCLVRVSKENRQLLDQYACLSKQYENLKEEYDGFTNKLKPLQDELEAERKKNKCLSDELNFMRKLHQEVELSNQAEMDALRKQLTLLKKDYLSLDVINGELRDDICNMRQQLSKHESAQKEFIEKICCLSDEIRSKNDQLHKLECNQERSEGICLAQELKGSCLTNQPKTISSPCADTSPCHESACGSGASPTKRCKRDEALNLKSAAECLGQALQAIQPCDPAQQKFRSIATDVQKLAECILAEKKTEEKHQKELPPVTNILCNKQCTQSCTKATCPEYMNKTPEDSAYPKQCACSKNCSSRSQKVPSTSIPEKTCPMPSAPSLVKATDTDDLLALPLPEKQPLFPCAQQPPCVVNKSEHYETPEPIPFLVCPYCFRKIHLLSTNCNQQTPNELTCPVEKGQCSEPTQYSLSSSHLNPCQAKICIQPTPPASFPVEHATCTGQPQYIQHSTCPHHQQINSSNVVKSVYLDVNELGKPAKGQQRQHTGPAEFLKSFSSFANGSSGPKGYQTDANYHYEANVFHSCCKSCQQQMSSFVPSGNGHKSSDQGRGRQIKLKKKSSTLVLYMEPNFTNNRSMSKTNVYYDCESTDTKKGAPKNLQTPDTFVMALKRLTCTAAQLLQNFERAMKDKELTARHQQNAKLKMTNTISSIKSPVAGPAMTGLDGEVKYVIPLSLKFRVSKGKKLLLDESETTVSIPINTPMILPERSNLKRY